MEPKVDVQPDDQSQEALQKRLETLREILKTQRQIDDAKPHLSD